VFAPREKANAFKKTRVTRFKSFLDKTVLTFQPGITGVVGPNGCGKSNIVDAIQWVMGSKAPNIYAAIP